MLFDDNLGFVAYNFITNEPLKSEPRLTSSEEGFARGNMFKELYKPYKNYTYFKLVPKTREEELLMEIMSLSFAINDLGLYLDLHPEDTEVLNKFKEYVEKSCKLEMEYVKNYGPLELIDATSKNRFDWIKNPWPWANEGGAKYV